MRPELARIVDRLVAGDAPITLDAIGEAIGTLLVAQDEIDAMLTLIEARGRKVETPEGRHGEARLKRVLDAARALREELGRAPKPAEIGARAGLTRAEVEHALALVRIMQR